MKFNFSPGAKFVLFALPKWNLRTIPIEKSKKGPKGIIAIGKPICISHLHFNATRLFEHTIKIILNKHVLFSYFRLKPSLAGKIKET